MQDLSPFHGLKSTDNYPCGSKGVVELSICGASSRYKVAFLSGRGRNLIQGHLPSCVVGRKIEKFYTHPNV